MKGLSKGRYDETFAGEDGHALDGGDQLGFARPSLSKSMLLVTENVVPLKVVHDATVDYMLHYLTRNRGKGNWSII